MRILIAEDDRETAEFIRRGLEQLGHNPSSPPTDRTPCTSC